MDKDITIDVENYRLNCRAGVIIIHDNKVLMHKNKNEDYYALLGGRVQFGENSQDTIVREVKEELGKDINVIGYVSTVENLFEFKNKFYQEILFVHLAEFVKKEDQNCIETIKCIEENKDYLTYEWVNINEMANLNIKPEAIKKVLMDGIFPVHVINDDVVKNKFNSVYNDEEIRNIYNEIQKSVDKIQFYAHHDFSHIQNVMNMTEKLLRIVNANENMIVEGKVAALLHDVGCIEGKENHAVRSYEFTKDYFDRKNIHFKNENLILDAIKNHSDGFDTDNIIGLCLILADKLDIKYTRITKYAMEIEGMRQIQYIRDIDVVLSEGTLNFIFYCDKEFDKEELDNYYFMKKVINAIKSFSNKMNYDYDIKFKIG